MNKKLFFSIIFIIITLAILIFLVSPLWIAVWQSLSDIKNNQAKKANIEDILAKTKEYKQIEEQAKKIFLALPKEKDIPDLMVQFNKLAYTNAMLMDSLRFTDPQEFNPEESEDPFASITVTLTVSGAYDDFKKYLAALETSLRSMDVNSIQFASIGPSSFIKFNLTIKVYYQ